MGWSEYRGSSSEELTFVVVSFQLEGSSSEGLTCVVVSFQLEEAEWVGLSIEEALQKV